MKQTIKFILILFFVGCVAFAQTVTPGQPLSVDSAGAVKRSFKVPTAKTLTLQSGSTLAIDDGTAFSFGSTAATAFRTALGDVTGTRVFTNTANRTASTPQFIGQVGFQRDDLTFWYGSALSAGAWTSEFSFGTVSATDFITAYSTTQTPLQITGGSGVAYFTRSVAGSDPVLLLENAASSGEALKITGSAALDALTLWASGTKVLTITGDAKILGNSYNADAAAPAYSFSGDPDTGLYRSAANTMGLSANGVNIATFGTTGLSLVTPLAVASGGTGAATAAAARTALNVRSKDVVMLSHQATDGTNGGASTAGSWLTRTITTEDVDTGGICTLAASVVTLPANTYRVRASAGFYGANGVKIRLYNNTTAAVLVEGTVGYLAAGTMDQIPLVGRFTLADVSNVVLQYWVQTASATGLGLATSFAGGVEVYATLEFEVE